MQLHTVSYETSLSFNLYIQRGHWSFFLTALLCALNAIDCVEGALKKQSIRHDLLLPLLLEPSTNNQVSTTCDVPQQKEILCTFPQTPTLPTPHLQPSALIVCPLPHSPPLLPNTTQPAPPSRGHGQSCCENPVDSPACGLDLALLLLDWCS